MTKSIVDIFVKLAKELPKEETEPKETRWGGDVKLKPHQERVHRRLEKAPGVLVYHGLGSGKTITSITAGAHLGLNSEVAVPASLRNNYRKEIDKVQPRSGFNVNSYEGFSKHPDASGKLLIADEGQRLRDPASHRSVALQAASHLANKRLILSGTPIQNSPEELAPIMNTVAGKHILPVGETFKQRFVQEKEVDPGFFAKLRGVKPGVEHAIKNENELAKTVRGLVDYHPSSKDGFPAKHVSHVDVEMDPRQKKVYETVTGRIPKSIFHKMERNLPPSKAESKQLNSFFTAARIVSNTPAPYQHGMSHEEGFARSPKLQRVFGDIHSSIKANPNHKSLVYSNYLEGGVMPLATALHKSGIPYGMFTGGMSDKARKQIVDDYNSGKSKVLLISGAGAEGLDLKGTRMVHVMEPHWNEARINQVIGRAIRYGSHSHLPEDQRHVHVRTYHSVLPEKGIFKKKRPTSADQYLKNLAARKQSLIDQFHKVLQTEGSRPV